LDGFVQGAKERAVHRVHFMHAVDLSPQVCRRGEAFDVDAADHQDSFLGFHLPGYVSSQFGGINLARFSAPPNVPTIQPAVDIVQG
jgi:hypothetical protein